MPDRLLALPGLDSGVGPLYLFWKGTIEPGKVADLCVMGGDLRAADPHDIPGIPIDLAVLGGEIVFERG